MRQLNKKQKKLLDKFIIDYHAGSGGNYPLSVDNISPIIWAEIEQANDHETLYQNANSYIMDQIMAIRYGRKTI